MPVTKSAHKALSKDRRRTKFNRIVKTRALTALKRARLKPSKESLQTAYSTLDKALKKGVFKKGKVSRLKSRLAKLAS